MTQSVKIRALAAEEIPLVFPLAFDALERNPRMGSRLFDPRSFYESLAPVLDTDNGVLLAAFDSDEVVGAMYGIVGRDALCGVMCANELLVAVLPAYQGGGVGEELTHAFEAWGMGKGATFFAQHVCHGGIDRRELLEAQGYVPWDKHYAKVVEI